MLPLLLSCCLALPANDPSTAWQESAPAPIAWESFSAVSAAGQPFEARLGRFSVPRDHAAPDGPRFELAFALYPSTSAEPGAPIYFLVGGPGASGTEYGIEFTTQALFDLRGHGDVVVLDQRGTGLSRPNIVEAPEFTYELPLDAPSTRASLASAHALAAADCAAHWIEHGVDPRAFTTVQSADDVEALRRALGHERIALYGVSYGSHLAIEYLRRHGARVERALLSRVEGPDDTYKLPSAGFAVLAALATRVAAEPAYRESLPDLVGSLRNLASRLAEEPVHAVVPQRGGDPLTVVLGPHDLQLVVASTLGDTRGQAFLPALVDAASRGDFGPLGHFALVERSGSVANAMGLFVDGSAGASAERLARCSREALDPTFVVGPALDAPYLLETCAALELASVGAQLRADFVCEAPVLFVSGALDGRTPPANAEALRTRFPSAAHIVFTNTAHDARELEFGPALAPLHAFLRGEAVADATVELPPLPLVPPRR